MQAIEAAYKGKEIKDAIVSALDKVNTNEGTARFLDGHGPSEFLSQEELNSILPLDNEPMPDSGKAISSGKIYSYLDKMSKAVDDVNGSDSSSSSSESIKDKLEYLNETKRAIRKELIDKGIEVDPDRDSFRSYAEKIGQIEMESNLAVEPLEITENGTYEAEDGYAYNPVIANVAFDLVPKTITKNGTYKAENEGHDGYSEVDVTASSALITKTVAGSDFPDEIETLEFKAADEGGDTIGYTQVDIDVSDKVEETKTIILEHDATGEELVYNASDDHVYGYGKVEILLHDTSQFFTVKFMSDGEVVYEEDHVEKGSSCSYKGRTLEKEGYVFSGWNPQPINIERNLTCVAKWVKDEEAQKAAGGSSGGGQTIGGMNWADVQAHPDRINTGDKKLIYWMPFSSNGLEFMGGCAEAHCIAKGEKGTNSTWYIQIDIASLTNNITEGKSTDTTYLNYVFPMGVSGGASSGSAPPLGPTTYHDMPIATFATNLASAIQLCKGEGYEGQSDLSFQSIEKKTKVYGSQGGVNQMITKSDTLSGLWLFSAGELGYATYDDGPAYPAFASGDGSLGRSIWYLRHAASRLDAERYGLTENQITLEALWLHNSGVSNFLINSNDGRYAAAISVVNNEGYINAYKGIDGYGGIIKAATNKDVGLGRSLSNVKFGFCL